jgi:hypothetical protein
MIMHPTLSIDPERQRLIEIAHNLRQETIRYVLSQTAGVFRTALATRATSAKTSA